MVRVRSQRGIALFEVLVASVMLVAGALAYFTLVPLIHRSQQMARHQSTAIQIANRMIEHLLLLRSTTLTADNLANLNLIERGQTQPPYSFKHLPMDDGWQYSPARVLPNGSGTMNVTTLANGATMVVIDITWTERAGGNRTYRTGTILGVQR
jgi:Tfp pilus assembly protein PilV